MAAEQSESPSNVVAARPFLDVEALLDTSLPRSQGSWFWPAAAIFGLIVFGSAYLSSKSGAMAGLVNALSGVMLIGVMVVMGLLSWRAFRHQRAEIHQLAAIEELVQLRRWSEAAGATESILSQPTRSPQSRVQGLIYLATILARYERFADVIHLYEYLLEHVALDPGTSHALKLGRAMALLREDNLHDADRAISDLRRDVSRANSAPTNDGPDGLESPKVDPVASGGLALIEMYRDVKTGHPDEAIEMFDKALPTMRRQLGHRVADAWALAARAHDLKGDAAAAQACFSNATTLSSAAEISRRYPELSILSQRFGESKSPLEAA